MGIKDCLESFSVDRMRSMKTEYNGRFRSIHFSWNCLKVKKISMVLLPGLKMQRASGRFTSQTAIRWLSMTPGKELSSNGVGRNSSIVSAVSFAAFVIVSGHQGSHPVTSPLSRSFAGRHERPPGRSGLLPCRYH